MRILELKLVPSRDGAQERFTISIHRKRNEEYISYSSFDVMAGAKDAERRIMIEDTDRLVIEAQADHTLVYDREQMVATPAPIDDAAKGQKEEFDKEQEELHKKNVEQDAKMAEEAAVGEPFRTNLGNVHEVETADTIKAKAKVSEADKNAAEAKAKVASKDVDKPKEATITHGRAPARGETPAGQRTPIDSDQVKK